MSFEYVTKGAKTLVLIVLISAIAAAIMTVLIWTQPSFIEILAQGNYWFILNTFLGVWLIASILAWVLVVLATRSKKGSVGQTLVD